MKKRVVNRFQELLALKERRENRRYSRRDLEEITGMSITSIQNWIHNRVTQYQEPQILAFCDFFKCTPGDLLIIEEIEHPEIETPLAATA